MPASAGMTVDGIFGFGEDVWFGVVWKNRRLLAAGY